MGGGVCGVVGEGRWLEKLHEGRQGKGRGRRNDLAGGVRRAG